MGRPRARLTLLGGFHLAEAGVTIATTSSGQRLLALLGSLGTMTRTVSAGILWPDATQARAQGSLRTTLWRLSRAGCRHVQAKGDCLGLDDAVEVDVQVFAARAQRLVDRHPVEEGDLDVFTMPRGDLLPGWYEEWVVSERERLRQLRLHALEVVASRLSQQGRYAEAIEAALAAIHVEPLRESAHRALIATYLSENNVIEAIRHLWSYDSPVGAWVYIDGVGWRRLSPASEHGHSHLTVLATIATHANISVYYNLDGSGQIDRLYV